MGNRITEQFSIKPDETILTVLSRLEKRKGHMMLLKALMLLETNKKVRILITGNDLDKGEYRRELEKFIKKTIWKIEYAL